MEQASALWTYIIGVAWNSHRSGVPYACGTDITGNTSAHAKEHMKAGEGSGHHSEIRQIVTGYNTVSHKKEGHWETRVVGGRWE